LLPFFSTEALSQDRLHLPGYHGRIDDFLIMPVFRLTEEPFFPDPALAEEDGLLAVGGDLSPGRLITAYSQGIFPWYSDPDPILWWYTSPRLVLFSEDLHVSKRLARYYRKPLFTITFDQCFERVMIACATVRTDKGEATWITDEMLQAYVNLHSLGYAHSVECWDGNQLAGGLYGILLDRVFFGESMFSTQNNGSKIALVALVDYLQRKDVKLIDCQMTTDHLLSMGAIEISGKSFSTYLKKYITTLVPDGAWTNDSKTREHL